ncbi:MAG: transglutaminase domain-containing protein [Acidobacteria bacterium]|nr:transglutaminase domain-containing protein [Acidobacteriota bacterium]
MKKYLKILFWLVVAGALLMCSVEAIKQYRDDRYIQALADEIVSKAGAKTPRERIVALREYILANVRYQGAAYYNRPFLRATATETLQSGLGYCGEVTRAFINLAGAVDIRAQRINLWGKDPHVVAEAEIGLGNLVIVDCQMPPKVKELERLDRVILQPEFDDYYTFNLRRMRLEGMVSRVRTSIGPLTYWFENPHALMAAFWGLLAISLTSGWFLTKGIRNIVRAFLLKRGWVHKTAIPGSAGH